MYKSKGYERSGSDGTQRRKFIRKILAIFESQDDYLSCSTDIDALRKHYAPTQPSVIFLVTFTLDDFVGTVSGTMHFTMHSWTERMQLSTNLNRRKYFVRETDGREKKLEGSISNLAVSFSVQRSDSSATIA